MDKNVDNLWKKVLSEIQTEVSGANFLTLFKSTYLISLEDNVATIAAPSTMIIDLLNKRYYKIIKDSVDGNTGKDNKLIWHLPDDMKFFKEKTMGHCIVTGRKNYESIPEKFRPLKGRTNIVVSRNKELQLAGAMVIHSLDEAINEAQKRNETECFIIGGGDIFRQALKYADRIYLTRIHHSFEGDVYFPPLDEEQWKEVSRTKFSADEKNPYDFSIIILEKKKR